MKTSVKILTASALLAVSSAALSAGGTGSSACGSKTLPPIQTDCADLNKSVDITNTPFAFNNPNASCNLGLSMPGLPTFGTSSSTSGMSACSIVKGFTSSTVGSMLNQAQQIINSANVNVGSSGVSVGGNTVLSGTAGQAANAAVNAVKNNAASGTTNSVSNAASSIFNN